MAKNDAVTEIPNYTPPAETQPTEFEIPKTAAPTETEQEKTTREAADFKARWQAGEKALAEQAPEIERMRQEILHQKKPPHSVKVQPTPTGSLKEGTTAGPAPKERKNAAHGASRGS